uniref:ankyrin repeat domain-containing protein 2-like n=1 Tax=Myxine glutinosa TaxID=7769 RepID=UPI00358E5315
MRLRLTELEETRLKEEEKFDCNRQQEDMGAGKTAMEAATETEERLVVLSEASKRDRAKGMDAKVMKIMDIVREERVERVERANSVIRSYNDKERLQDTEHQSKNKKQMLEQQEKVTWAEEQIEEQEKNVNENNLTRGKVEPEEDSSGEERSETPELGMQESKWRRKSSAELHQDIVRLAGCPRSTRLRRRRLARAASLPQAEPQAEPQPPEGPVDGSMFLQATCDGHLRVVEHFLADGGDANTCDKLCRTGLHRASMEGHLEIVECLLSAGASPIFQDRLGGSAVHWACRGGHLAVVRLLVEHGAALSSRDKLNSCPLHVATRTGHTDCTEYLIGAGANINARDWEGDTALHDAVRLGRYKLVRQLILHGADLQIKNCANKTPLDLVRKWDGERRGVFEREASSG